MDFDNPIAKTVCLAQWVRIYLQSSPGNFIKSLDLYNHYTKYVSSPALVSQVYFLKEVEFFMAAYNIKPSRICNSKGRGYVGLGLKG